MKSEIKTEITITFDPEEARWLNNIIQNPIGCNPEDETHWDRDMRQKIWKALNFPALKQ